MISNYILATLILTLVWPTAKAQQFLNLDFEYEGHFAEPRKWMIEGEADDYNAVLDTNMVKTGRKSLFVSLKKGDVYTYLSLPANAIRGKRLRIEGFIRLKNSDTLQTMLVLRNPTTRKPINAVPIYIKSSEWTRMQIEASLPLNYDADRLLIAVVATGSGDFWLDDFKITLNDTLFGNGQADFREPTLTELSILNEQAVPIEIADTNFQGLSSITRNANIVALGENSHGSASIYQYKLGMIRQLVQHDGFSIFALETPMKEAESVNKYVVNGTGTLQEVIPNLVYPSWKTKEMLDIIEWIHDYNETHTSKVEFKGFDSLNPGSEKSRDEQMAENIRQILQSAVNKKMIISADNTHVSKSSGKMGNYLHHWYGSSYCSVGFTYGHGTYAAYGSKQFYPVHLPYIGTYEYVFSKCTYKNFIIDLRTIQNIPILNITSGFRTIGSRPQEVCQFNEITLKDHFDAIVYLETSIHTNQLSK